MKIPESTTDALNEAMNRFDNELRSTSEWENWTEDAAFKYAIERDGKLYPVKKVVSLATGMPVSQFSGGDQANGYIEGYGLKAVEINPQTAGIKQCIDQILVEYLKAAKEEDFGRASSVWPTFKLLQQALSASEPVKKHPNISVEWSAGLGNWARIPWVAFLDKSETNTTKKGVYCVFLFRQNMSGVI
jgi:5-methylcytosine-specific restriction enzyme B